MASLFPLLCKLYVHLQFDIHITLYGISVVRPINNNYFKIRKNVTEKLNSLEFFSSGTSEPVVDKEVSYLLAREFLYLKSLLFTYLKHFKSGRKI